VHLIQSAPTQANYSDALTVPPQGWDGIEVSISAAACIMQLITPHEGVLDEILVQPGTLSLGNVGGVRFKTNPATPGLAAVIDAYAARRGEPVIGGLSARDQLPSIFGPTLFNGVVSVPNGAPLRTLFTSPVPGNWASLLLRFVQPGAGELWHYQAQWTHSGNPIVNFDFYTWTTPNSPTIAIPILGDTLTLTARHTAVAAQNLTVQAYLSNFAPFSVWQRSEWTLLFFSQLVSPGANSTSLPLFAGQTQIWVNAGVAANMLLDVIGRDEAGTLLSRPLEGLPFPSISFGQSFILPPHRNAVQVTNNTAGNVQVDYTVIGQRT
jgi:hypothetical protein